MGIFNSQIFNNQIFNTTAPNTGGGGRILFAYPKVKEKQQFKIRVVSKLFYVDTLVIKSKLVLHQQLRIRSEIIPPDIITRSSDVKISTNIDSIKVKSKQGLIIWESEDEEDSSQ